MVFHVHKTPRLRPGGTSNLVLETSIGLGSKLKDFRVDVGVVKVIQSADISISMWVFPKIGVPPNHPFL